MMDARGESEKGDCFGIAVGVRKSKGGQSDRDADITSSWRPPSIRMYTNRRELTVQV